MRFWLVVVLAGCAHTRPDVTARARIEVLAAALDSGNAESIDALIVPAPPASRGREVRARAVAPELKEAAAALRAAAKGSLELRARVHLGGPLGLHVTLEREEETWRVDPDSVGLDAPTPRAAVEQLAVALDRLETDPALVLLTRELRSDVVESARSRAAGLRDLARRLPGIDPGHVGWPLDLDYGDGLFVRLRAERGQWRVDDFN